MKTHILSSDNSVAEILRLQKEAKELHWYVLYVRQFHERRLVSLLQEQGLESYVPVRRELHNWSDRKKWIERVLTPQMIFVRVALTNKNSVFIDKHIVRFLTVPGKSVPAAIADVQMDAFRRLTEQTKEEIDLINTPLKKGDMVRIVSGALIGIEGELLRVDKNCSKVVVRLNEILSAAVELPINMFERII